MFLDAQMALNNPKIKFVYKYSKIALRRFIKRMGWNN